MFASEKGTKQWYASLQNEYAKFLISGEFHCGWLVYIRIKSSKCILICEIKYECFLLIFDFDKKPKVYEQLSLHYDIVPTICKNYIGIKNDFYDFYLKNLRSKENIIKVYGSGCANCNKLEQMCIDALQELNINATVGKVNDMQEIMKTGILFWALQQRMRQTEMNR